MDIRHTEIEQYFQTGRYIDVLECARLCDPGDPVNASDFRLAGIAALRLHWLIEAVANLESCLSLDRSDAEAWRNLGMAWYELRMFAQAEHGWAQAERLGSLDPVAAEMRRIARIAHGTIAFDPSARLAEITAANVARRDPDVVNHVPGPERLPVLFSLGEGHQLETCLTIDDGPSDSTSVILAELGRHGVKAAFFVVGQSAEARPKDMEAILAGGHEVYSHGFSHSLFPNLTADAIVDELERTEQVLRRYRPTPSPYPMRLPGGMGWTDPKVHAAIRRWNPDVCLIHWSAGTRDSQSPRDFRRDADITRDVTARVLEAVHASGFPASVLLAHDDLFSGKRVHPMFLRAQYRYLTDTVRDLGMRFVPLAAAVQRAIEAQRQTEPQPSQVAAAPAAVNAPAPRQAPALSKVHQMTEVFRIDCTTAPAVVRDFDLNGLPWPPYLATMRLPWIDHSRPYAYALLHERRFVGWIQTICARRELAGQQMTVCNLSAWYVLDEFRSSSMKLMFAISRDLADIPITVHTASPLAVKLYEALKWNVTDDQRFGFPVASHNGPEAIGDEAAIFLLLDPRGKQIANDHQHFAVRHCMIQGSRSNCHFTYRIRNREDETVADLLHISGDLDLFFTDWRPPAGSDLARCKVLLVDRRFLGDRDPRHPEYSPSFRRPRMFHGDPALRPHVDFLYSEVVTANSGLG